MLPFKPISKTTISGEIIGQIMSMLHGGTLKPADKLPSERELSKILHVGRSSIREALKGLETVGLIRRTNEGTVLCEPRGIEFATLWLSANRSTIHEVIEVRKLIEIELAGLAADRATSEDIKRIEETITDIVDLNEVPLLDRSFHHAVTEAAKNSVFSLVYNLITDILFQTHKYYSLLERNGNEEFEAFIRNAWAQHRKIFRAIKSKDSNGAKAAVRKHLQYGEKHLLGKADKTLPQPSKRIASRPPYEISLAGEGRGKQGTKFEKHGV